MNSFNHRGARIFDYPVGGGIKNSKRKKRKERREDRRKEGRKAGKGKEREGGREGRMERKEVSRSSFPKVEVSAGKIKN